MGSSQWSLVRLRAKLAKGYTHEERHLADTPTGNLGQSSAKGRPDELKPRRSYA